MTKKAAGVIVATPKGKGGENIDGVVMTIILIAGSVSDLKSYRIPNIVILSGWLSGLAFHLYRGGISEMGDGLFCIVVSILALLPFYLLRVVGAGDVKLLSVISGFYGLAFWGRTGVVFLFLAAAVSVIKMFRKKIFFKRFRYLINYVLYDRKSAYYDRERDGTDMVTPMAPLLALAYYFVYFSGGSIL